MKQILNCLIISLIFGLVILYGCEAQTDQIFQPPETILLNLINDNEISISWDKVEGVNVYNLDRAESANFSDAVNVYSGQDTSFYDTDLNANTVYYYRLSVSLRFGIGYAKDSIRTADIEIPKPPIDSKELIVGGDMNDPLVWNYSPNWTFQQGKAIGVGAGSLSQDRQTNPGTTYVLNFDLTRDAGSCAIYLVGNKLGIVSSADHYVFEATQTGTSNRVIDFYGDKNWVGSVDNVSIKEKNDSIITPEPPEPPPASGNILNDNPSFEDGTWQNQWRDSNSETVTDSFRGIEIDNILSRSGGKSLRLYHKDFFRAEIVSLAYTNHNGDRVYPGGFEVGKEYWIGVSYYLKDWNTNPAGWNALMQSHGTPYNGDWTCGAGVNGFTIGTENKGNGHVFGIQAGIRDDAMTYIPSNGAMSKFNWTMPVPENVWIDVVGHFIQTYEPTGLMQWWVQVDGGGYKKVIDVTGRTTLYLDKCGRPRFHTYTLKIGSYNGGFSGARGSRDMRVDNIRISGSNGNFQLVDPSK